MRLVAQGELVLIYASIGDVNKAINLSPNNERLKEEAVQKDSDDASKVATTQSSFNPSNSSDESYKDSSSSTKYSSDNHSSYDSGSSYSSCSSSSSCSSCGGGS